MSDIESARLKFTSLSPYLYTALMRHAFVEVDWVDTCGVTEGMVLLYNPDYFKSLSVLQAATRLWHEVGHWQRGSFLRSTILTNKEWSRKSNIAADLAINSSGKDGGWDFGPDGLLPSAYGLPDFLTYEEYYSLLPDNPAIPAGKTWGGQCGTGAGNPIDLEKEEEVDRLFGKSKVDQKIIAQDVAREIKDFSSKGIGKIPSHLIVWADSMLVQPKVPWTTIFGCTLMQCAGDIIGGTGEYSYSRVSRRSTMLNSGIVLPGAIEQEIEVCIVLDTSGSMGLKTEIEPALAETRAVLQTLGLYQAWLLQVDADSACEPRRVRPEDLRKMDIHGRGGTDFRPAFVAAKKLRPKPSLLVYMTDGAGPAPTHAPFGMETIWCIFGAGPKPATWGREVRVDVSTQTT